MSPFGLLDALLCPPPDPARVSWLASVTYAHRGLPGAGLIDNSPRAFAAALARGMGIECDVQRSRDGQAMVFHDWELDRLTGETGPVKARGSEELGKAALTGSENLPTTRELDVLRLAADGSSVGEIAHRLYLSVGTVRNYLSKVIGRTGARNRIDAIRIAREAGWLTDGPEWNPDLMAANSVNG